MSEIFYLQDSRGLTGDNMMFWAIGGSYTSDLRKAEPFTKESAVAQHQSRETDIPWPADYLLARQYPAVDMQHLRQVNGSSQDVSYYCQLPGRFVGNDVVWATIIDGVAGTDLSCAGIFPLPIAGGIMWPVDEIQKIARPAVRARDCLLKEALAGTGIVLQKPKRARREVFNCGHCGRFISELRRFSDCQNCGGDNRP